VIIAGDAFALRTFVATIAQVSVAPGRQLFDVNLSAIRVAVMPLALVMDVAAKFVLHVFHRNIENNVVAPITDEVHLTTYFLLLYDYLLH
jgi:hypothetical protein